MACGNEHLFPPYFDRFNTNSILMLVNHIPSEHPLSSVNQYVISAHSESICSAKYCNFHILVVQADDVDTTELLASFQHKILYQPVDCLFTCFSHYFNKILKSKGDIIDKLREACSFHQNLKYPILSRPSVARKRLLRKRFKQYPKGSRNNQTPNCVKFNGKFLLQIEYLLNSHIGDSFYYLVQDLYLKLIPK